MSNFLNHYPYSDIHELNLDWIMAQMKALAAEMKEYEAANSVSNEGIWDITKQYTSWSIVQYGNEAYMSIKPVPQGIELTNEEYWKKIGTIIIDESLNKNSLNAIANRPVALKLETHDNDITQLSESLETEINTRTDNDTQIENTVNELNSLVHSTVQELNAEISTRSTADTVLNGRIDEILDGASVDPDAELLDIRVGANGITYPSAGAAVRTQLSIEDNSIKYVNKKTVNDYVTEFGWTEGKLANDGTITSNSEWRTIGDYIPVTAGDYIYFDSNGATSYSFLRATYDSSKSLIQFLSLTPSTAIQTFGIPEGTSYVRFSVSATRSLEYHCTSISENNIGLLKDADIKHDATFDRIDNCIRSVDLGKKYGWFGGKLNTSNGTVDGAQTNFVTTGFMPVTAGNLSIEVPNFISGYTLFRAFYDENKNFIQGTSLNVLTKKRDWTVLAGVRYVKYCVSTGVFFLGPIYIYMDSEFSSGLLYSSASHYENSEHSYAGSVPDLQMVNKCTIHKPIKMYDGAANSGNYTAQGFAIYNNVVFQCLANDTIRLYDLNNHGNFITDLTTEAGHGNSVMFTNSFYSDSDEFPELLISDTDTSEVFLYRVSRSSATLIQTYSFPYATFGYFAQMAFDRSSGATYIIGNSANSSYWSSAKITKVDMSDLTYNGDGTYTPAVIDTFNVVMPSDVNYIVQGVNALNGNIYIASGAQSGTQARIVVISTASESIITNFNDFPADIIAHELEDIEFLPSATSGRYEIICYFRTYGYYAIVC